MPRVEPRERLKNLVHFICRECGTDPSRLGKVKLHKIIYYSDLYRLRTKAKPITGVEFVKYPFGPFIPEIDEVLSELEKEGKLQIIPRDEFNEYDNIGLVGKGTPYLQDFEDREVSIVREQINEICPETATHISDKSHGPIWQMTEMFAPMPIMAEIAYQLIQVTDEDIAYAESLPE